MRHLARYGLVLGMAAGTTVAVACSWGSAGAPRGWKTTTDPTGSCQVATPSGWQIGREFFLKKEPADIRETAQGKQAFPPRGLALWPADGREKTTPAAAVRSFQVRRSLVLGESVCSVWRIKAAINFTAEEETTMQQVGNTLRWVR